MFPSNQSRFLVSTKPTVSPQTIAQRLKGRLQYLLRPDLAKPFKRTYGLRSLGNASRTAIEYYVANQLGHHRMADPRVQRRMADYQFVDDSVDLSREQCTSHAKYWYNLHLVFVNDQRYHDINWQRFDAILAMTRRTAKKKKHRLSRAAILADHIHLALGAHLRESPMEIAFGYLNNLAYALGMTRVFQHSYFVGTFGEYNMNALRRYL